MPFPWSKASSKEKDTKKKNSSSKDKLEGVLPKLHHLGKKAYRLSEDDRFSSSKGSRTSSDSPRPNLDSPSSGGMRTPSFAEKMARGQPLPLPPDYSNRHHLRTYNPVETGLDLDAPTSGYGSVSVSSASSVSSAEVPEYVTNTGGFHDYDGQTNVLNSFRGAKRTIQNDTARRNPAPASKGVLTSPKKPLGREQKANLHVNVPARSAPTSLFSSPCHSPRRLSSSEQYAFFSVQRMPATYNASNAEAAAYFQVSPEKSPLASPRRSSVSPLRSGLGTESPGGGHRLPPPPSTAVFSNSPVLSPNSPASPLPHVLNGPTTWQKGNLLGYGSFGSVYKGFSNSGTFCAMKEVLIVDDPKSKESVKQLMQEINMLSSLRHPNIVQYLGSEMLEDRLYIYLEFVSGGSIQKVLQEYGAFKEPVIRSYTHQILSGLSYLHSMSKVHRDIKGANILVDTNGEVKLADFGMAKHISSNSLVLSFKGSPYWMAPEVLKNNAQSYPVDIWSLGCTIVEMATGKPPWSQYEGVAAMFKIGSSRDIPDIPEHLSSDAQDFLRLCLQRNPEDRPTATQLLEHPFVKLPYEEQMGSRSPTLRNLMGESRIAEYSRTQYLSRDNYFSKPVSPIGSPSMHPRSPAYSLVHSAASTPPRATTSLGSRSPVSNGAARNEVLRKAHTPDASPRRSSYTPTRETAAAAAAGPFNSQEAKSFCRYYGNGVVAEKSTSCNRRKTLC